MSDHCIKPQIINDEQNANPIFAKSSKHQVLCSLVVVVCADGCARERGRWRERRGKRDVDRVGGEA
jgi:hypothetical protein